MIEILILELIPDYGRRAENIRPVKYVNSKRSLIIQFKSPSLKSSVKTKSNLGLLNYDLAKSNFMQIAFLAAVFPSPADE